MKVVVVAGGKSGEHEVSLRSAASVTEGLNKQKYTVEKVLIGKDGKFDLEKILSADVVFPLVHGTYGEDGCLQGLLEMYDKAYVGAGVLGSAVGMDKDVQKRLLMQSGIEVAKYWVVGSVEEAKKLKLRYPVFVKPANMGSSVGVSKVNKEVKLTEAIKKAFAYDAKVLVEEMVEGREMEVAILDGQASMPGEVIPVGHEFYDYEAKYIDENGAKLMIPAKLPKKKNVEIRELAEKVFSVLGCEEMARVDMFLKADGTIVINEINTLPGFTDVSMYKRLWMVSGLSYSKLLDRLITAAIKRKKGKCKLERNFS